MSTYNPNVPTGIVPLDQDYKNLQLNFQQADNSFGIDHLKFSNNTTQNGFHTVVHLIPFSTLATNPPNNYPISQATSPPSVPPNAALTGELFTAQVNDGINSDESLYYQSGGGRLSQLTRNFQPINAGNGASFLPGGLIIQWGSFNPNSSTTVVFPQAFTATPYMIQLTGSASNNSTFRAGVATGSVTTTQFQFQGTIDSHWNPIYWLAIGT